MLSTSFNAIAVGLRGAGKTTYLAALWNLLEDGRERSSVRLARLQPDREYLEGIRGTWLDLTTAQRTSGAVVEQISLNLEVAGQGSPIELQIPDLSGELFASQWDTRRTTRSYAEHAAGVSGILLFVHPGAIHPAPRLGPSASAAVGVSESVPWDAQMAPTQVQLVECLQFAAQLRRSKAHIRISVVASAWDLVGDRFPPRDWFERRLPLLFQFLECHGGGYDARYYGVSAQGGRWPEDKVNLQNALPCMRPFVVDSFTRDADLAKPILWLAQGEDAL